MKGFAPGTIWLALMVIFAFNTTGCAPCRPAVCLVSCQPIYHQVVLTDVEGRWISEYLAEGTLTTSCDGTVCFTALYRRIFTPYQLTFRYPYGRWVKVRGSHVLISPACPPHQLADK